ncbi:amidohydrolase [Aquincola sp. S2]|uniref:Amidohydrolase n=1 Tax=Pseudaquabacterium terrae TaxID=2732868 RepID=A0ABX2ETN7_9BURK|nr:amidohydrolase [Aquabacterium terrae]NRF71963.1 amidohydrolase [Aquabacterium terrae]
MRAWNWKATLAAAAVAASVVVGCGGDSAPEPADVVLRGGKVVTMDAQRGTAQAVAVRDGRISFVGSDAEASRRIGASTRVVELGGRMLMPGFIDAHLHAMAGGRALLLCDLAYAPLSRAQLAAKLQACLDATADAEPDRWLEAVNWDRQSTASLDADPTRAVLDGLKTRRPIVVTSSDFHAVLANSRAFALAGIQASTPDPAGGSFLRDASGQPTGICVDAAGFQVKAAIPPDSEADQLTQGRAALAALRAQGITSFMDAAADATHLRVFKALRDKGELTARVQLALNADPAVANADPARSIADAKAVAAGADAGAPSPAPGVFARVIKVFLDGVVNAPADNGALLTPYFENAGTEAAPQWLPGTNLGQLYYGADALKALMLAAVDAGFDMHLHATGDRAVRSALDAVAAARQARPQGDFRPALAHVETAAVADLARFAALDVTATMSFQWAQRAPYSIGETENHLGPERFARMEPSGSLRRAGARIAHGSDWPIDPFDTFLALKVGVTRSGDPANPHSAASLAPIFQGRLNAEPGLSRDDALAAITINAAHQLRLERHLGSIEPGKLADLIVLERDFLTVPEEELGRNRVLLTMVGGRIVAALDPFGTLLATPQQALNARARVLSPRGSTGHATSAHASGTPRGDGHRH